MSDAPLISISPTALQHLKRMLQDPELEGHSLRFGIQGGGCSGYSYLLEFEREPEPEDLVYTFDGVQVFLANLRRDFLAGVVIDFVDELLESGFKIRNPNVKRACGCGESFDVPEAVQGEVQAAAPA